MRLRHPLSLLAAAALFATAVSGAPESSEAPAETPGIAGLKMTDARDNRHLWAEIGKLQSAAANRRMTPADFRTQAIERTAQYLALEGDAAKRFSDESLASVKSVREAAVAHATAGPGGAEEAAYDAALAQAIEAMRGRIGDSPRAQLLEPQLTKWVMKLAMGASDPKVDRSGGRRWTPQPASTANRKTLPPATAP